MLRSIIWAKFLKLDKNNNDSNYFNVYIYKTNVLIFIQNLINDPNSPYENEIRKDINRSLPNCNSFINKEHKFNYNFYIYYISYDRLYNVLKAFSIHNPKIGFCQSLAPIVSFLLTTFNSEVL